jgi:putative DNA base modification enzyme with NMAD domain
VAAFLANVGVNAAHSARSPLNPDGSFTVLPIPEAGPARPPMRSLSDPDLEDLGRLVPPGWRSKAVHLDPDFRSTTPTYGDNCRTAGRAFNLRRAEAGDVIWFVARLHDQHQCAALHVVGKLEICRILRDVTEDPGPGWWDANAHVRRGRATDTWNSFWVFEGTKESGWLPVAIKVMRPTLEALFGLWDWPARATEQQVIAWHTRAVRRIA